MKHFEQLWEEAELSSMQHNLPKDEILANIRKLLEIYLDLERPSVTINHPPGYVSVAKEKALGDVLLLLANLSRVDTIDVFKALAESVQRSNIRASHNNIQKTTISDEKSTSFKKDNTV